MMIARSIDSLMSECMNRLVRRNTSTLHADGRSFHDSLEALAQCSAQDGRPSPRSLLAMSCQFWVCWRVGPRTRLRKTGQQARLRRTCHRRTCVRRNFSSNQVRWPLSTWPSREVIWPCSGTSVHALNSTACHGRLRIGVTSSYFFRVFFFSASSFRKRC